MQCACGLVVRDGFRPVCRAARGVTAALVLLLAIAVLLAAEPFVDTLLVRSSSGWFDAWLETSLTVGRLAPLAAFGFVVALAVWSYLASRNVERVAGGPGGLAVGWAPAGWFIPLANLVVPGLVVADLARRSLTGTARDRLVRLVGAWWVTLALALAVWYAALLFPSAGDGTVQAQVVAADGPPAEPFLPAATDTWPGLLVLAYAIGVAVLTRGVVNRITRAQHSRAAG